MTDILKLLSQKTLTGRELGILEIVNMATVFRQQIAGEKVTPPVSAEKLQCFVDSMTDVCQSRIYNGYMMIHEWISLYYNISQTNYQQAQLRFQSLYTSLFQATASLKVALSHDSQPTVLSKEEADEAAVRYLKRGYGAVGENLAKLVFRAIDFYTDRWLTRPHAFNPIADELSRLVHVPIASERVRTRLPSDFDTLGLLKNVTVRQTVFPCTLGQKTASSEVFLTELMDLYTVFRTLIPPILTDIDYHYPFSVPVSHIPVSDWQKTTVTLSQLYDWDFYGFCDSIGSLKDVWHDTGKEISDMPDGGVALRNPLKATDSPLADCLSTAEAETDMISFFAPYSLETLASEEGKERLAEISESRENLLASCYFLNGYNIALVLIADAFEIPEISVFAADMQPIREQVRLLGEMTDRLNDCICKTPFLSEEQKKRKSELLACIFQKPDISALEAPKENREKVCGMFDDFSAFRDSRIADLLCFRSEKAADAERKSL